MAVQSIQKIKIGENEYPIDAVTLDEHPASDFQLKSNIVKSIDSSCTDDQYPSAKCVYNELSNIETRLKAI